MGLSERVRHLCLPILAAAMLAATVYAQECIHEYEYHRVESVCSAQGYEWYECIYCGFTQGYALLPEVPHEFSEWRVLEGPTCTQPGVQARNCLVCGAQEEEELPPPGHVYEPEVRLPTCSASGYTRYNCRSCSDYYIADYTQPLGHGYDDGVLIKEPTDTALGRVRFTCTRCSETYLMTYAFRDIDSNAFYFTPVLWAVNTGVTSGIDETHFGPELICSRAQAVTFLWRAAGEPEPESANNPFADVPVGCFYEKAVLWAFERGITTGTDAEHFSPSASCNRAQVVTFLHRFRGCPEPTVTTVFPDVSEGTYYHSAVLWAAGRGITVGMDGGRFRPEIECSRAQIVTFLYRDEKNP